MNHAYLIMAHSNLPMLQAIISSIDDCRNDIFVHIDKKASFDGSTLIAHRSNLQILPERIDAAWGDYSLVSIEMELFRYAFKSGPYSYYHLLSGADIPIKSQDYIHSFCDKHQGFEFIAYSNIDEKDLRWRSGHRFILTRHFRDESFLFRAIRGVHVRLQDLFCPKKMNMVIKKGSQWCSLTNGFVSYLLDNEDLIKSTFARTFAPDEMFVQSIAWNSHFKDHIFDSKESACGNMRYIKWKDREPMEIEPAWVQEMVNSKHWFARKCNDITVLQMVSKSL